ncbi:MAG: ATP-grasp domain-containing protein [Erysipelotrichaceae bacterium]|nr:ATP-grasp domain-containing protein [Erysipelotrichaceae bacterium]
MKTIMILGGTPFQLPVIKKALEMGLRVVVADWNPEAIGFKEEGVIPEVMSIIDDEAVLAAAKKHKIDGILTICTDTPVRTIAKVVSELNLPGITEEAAFRCTDKAAMRTRWKECGIPIPKFYNVTTKDEYLEAVSHFPEKCVVKAVDNSGSRGIQLIYDVTDQAKVEEAFDYCKQFSRSGELVVEEFMEGPEVCVETLNQHGVCYPIQITDQLAKEPPYFTDCGYNQPTLLPDEIASEIRKITAAANIALGNNDGSSCTELIITKDGPKVVELGPRLGADGVTTVMVPLSTGISMVENVRTDHYQGWS